MTKLLIPAKIWKSRFFCGMIKSKTAREKMMKNTPSYIIGIDLGTGSCKCALLHPEGTLLGLGSSPYPQQSDQPQWKVQAPYGIYLGMIQAVKDVLAKADVDPQDCRRVSIGCALHGLMALDPTHKPLTPVFTWADDRAGPQAARQRGTDPAGELYQATGCPPHGMYPLYKVLWVKENHPTLFDHTALFTSVKEYIVHKLTGELLVDPSLAAGSGFLNAHTLDWNPASLELAGISPDQLSPLAEPTTTLPITDQEFLRETGLPADLPLVLGTSDAVNSSLGAGAVTPQGATCMVGTSAAYRIIAQKPILSETGSTWCYAIDREHWLVGGALNNGGLALTWLRDTLRGLGKKAEGLTFQDILTLAEKSPPGSGGVICLPLFAGERSPNWNLDARGSFVGISVEHDLSHLSRAALEGIAYRLRGIDRRLRDMGCQIDEVRASGGFTKSPFWTQLMTDVLGLPLSIPAEGETSALGAALWALAEDQGTTPYQAAEDIVKIKNRFSPTSADQDIYARGYELSQTLYRALSPHFEALVNFQDEAGS
jgi:gluconokinase